MPVTEYCRAPSFITLIEVRVPPIGRTLEYDENWKLPPKSTYSLGASVTRTPPAIGVLRLDARLKLWK